MLGYLITLLSVIKVTMGHASRGGGEMRVPYLNFLLLFYFLVRHIFRSGHVLLGER